MSLEPNLRSMNMNRNNFMTFKYKKSWNKAALLNSRFMISFPIKYQIGWQWQKENLQNELCSVPMLRSIEIGISQVLIFKIYFVFDAMPFLRLLYTFYKSYCLSAHQQSMFHQVAQESQKAKSSLITKACMQLHEFPLEPVWENFQMLVNFMTILVYPETRFTF